MLAVDVGGTFTDVIGVRDGVIEAIKVPSDAAAPERSVLTGADALGVSERAVFNHASTVGLNAIITRRLPKVGFMTTLGHRDMLDAGSSRRPLAGMSDAGWRRSFGDATAPLVPRYLRRGVRERIWSDGRVLVELDEEQAAWELRRMARCSVEGVAICLINSYVDGRHEHRLRELAREILGPVPCSISCEVSPLAKEYARASTTVIDVCMKLIYGDYAHRLESGLRERGFSGELNYADGAAMLAQSAYAMRTPSRVVFSGPAAGAVASAHFGSILGDHSLLCCDVGGTSSDISVVTQGAPVLNTTFELEHDLVVNALSVELGSLGAGGGSVVSITPSGEIRVGPESVGGDPGPACYGKGGTLPTMTDAALLLGILDPSRFNDGTMRLDPAPARAAFENLETTLSLPQRISYAYRIGLNNIAEGLIDVSIGRGIDPRDYSLMAFGAAGPLMLPSVLDLVNARRVIVPPHPGLFSAVGLLSSDLVYSESRTAYVTLTAEAAPRIAALFDSVQADVRRQLPDGHAATIRRSFDGRLLGQSWETPFVDVPAGDLGPEQVELMIGSFHDVYESRFGNRFSELAVEGVTYRVEAVIELEKVTYPRIAKGGGEVSPRCSTVLAGLGDADALAGEYERDDLRAGDLVRGPAIIREPMSTTHVRAGQVARVGDYGELVIQRSRP
jgi:N-methylhydantoinase A